MFKIGVAEDPFKPQKMKQLEAVKDALPGWNNFCAKFQQNREKNIQNYWKNKQFVNNFVSGMQAELSDTSITTWLVRSLWGNVADLSLSAGQKVWAHFISPPILLNKTKIYQNVWKLCNFLIQFYVILYKVGNVSVQGLVVDETEAAVAEINKASHVGLVTDNAGLEIVSDLMLIDRILLTGKKVTLLAKDVSVFVWPKFKNQIWQNLTNEHTKLCKNQQFVTKFIQICYFFRCLM